MKTLLLPLALLALGTGAGAGVGLMLAPTATEADAPPGDAPADAGDAASPAEAGHDEAAAEGEAPPAEDAAEEGGSVAGHDYVRFNNQFVIPIVTDGEVASLVLMSLSVEVPAGQEDAVLMVEPKLRDVFLQVLFDHANTGGFEGMFTAASAMRTLRASLLAAAQDEIGDLVTDVLIVELVRQDT